MSVQEAPSTDTVDLKTERLVFISHKHSDSGLADLVAGFLRSLSAGQIDAHVSSSVQHEGPRFGQPLPAELKSALARSGLVILVYTDPNDDWEWCLWECGVATNPSDDTPTRVEVFSFAGATPKPYETTLTVRLVTEDGTIEEGGEVSLQTFATQFCREKDFWPDGQGPVAPKLRDDEIAKQVKQFMRDLQDLGPVGVDRARRDLLEATRDLSPEAARFLVPAVQRAVRALAWGTAEGPHHHLFKECWHSAYVGDLEKLAAGTLVFRPPSLGRFWELLLKSATEVCPPERDEPWICLVSGEDREDPIEFWHQAMADPTAHARTYEDAVRDAARRLRTTHGKDLVERRFLFERSYFRDAEERIGLFDAIARWMNDAGVTVSIGRRDDVTADWRDFALVGDLAVSRFASVKGVDDRVLEETFAADDVERATTVWRENIQVRWTSAGDATFADFIAGNDGLV